MIPGRFTWKVIDTPPTTKTQLYTRVHATLRLPVVFHLVPHVFLGIGPFLRMDLLDRFTGDSGTALAHGLNRTFGLATQIGVWF